MIHWTTYHHYASDILSPQWLRQPIAVTVWTLWDAASTIVWTISSSVTVWARYLCDALDTFLRDTLVNLSPLRIGHPTSAMFAPSPGWFGHYGMPPLRLIGHSSSVTVWTHYHLPQRRIGQPTALMVWTRYHSFALDIRSSPIRTFHNIKCYTNNSRILVDSLYHGNFT